MPSDGQSELAALALHHCYRGLPSALTTPDSGLVSCAPCLRLYSVPRIICGEEGAGGLVEQSALMESAQHLLLLQQHVSLKAVLASWEYCEPALHFRVWSLVCGLLGLLYISYKILEAAMLW